MIVVTGATGNIGSELLHNLAAKNADVRAVTRTPGRIVVPPSIEAAYADLSHPESLDPVFSGARALFLLTNTGPVDEVLDVAASAGIRHLVLVTSLLAHTHPGSAIGKQALDDERALRDSELEWTVLRPWEFASNVLAWVPMLRESDVVTLPTAGLPSPTIHPADIAAVATAALTEDTSIHANVTYPLTGPELLTPADKVSAISDQIGRPLTFREDPDPIELQRIAADAPDDVSRELMVPGVSGLTPPGVLNTVHEVTGSSARTFRQWVRDSAHLFPSGNPEVGAADL